MPIEFREVRRRLVRNETASKEHWCELTNEKYFGNVVNVRIVPHKRLPGWSWVITTIEEDKRLPGWSWVITAIEEDKRDDC